MTFKLEVGKSYLSRRGEVVRIAEHHPYDDGFCYSDDGGRWYRSNGAWLDGCEHKYDLISELKHYDSNHSHYKKDVSNISKLDIYRVLELFEVRSHAVGHAVKKLLMAGNRGAKDYGQDIREAIDSLNRELQMKQEDSNG